MTITYRDQLSRDLTPSEVDANFRHVLDPANQSFTASGSGLTRTVEAKLQEYRSRRDYTTEAIYQTKKVRAKPSNFSFVPGSIFYCDGPGRANHDIDLELEFRSAYSAQMSNPDDIDFTEGKFVDVVNGSDGNAGTYAAPYLTIRKAIQNVTTGTVWMLPGTGTARLDVRESDNYITGTTPRAILIKALGGPGTVTLRAPGDQPSALTWTLSGSVYTSTPSGSETVDHIVYIENGNEIDLEYKSTLADVTGAPKAWHQDSSTKLITISYRGLNVETFKANFEIMYSRGVDLLVNGGVVYVEGIDFKGDSATQLLYSGGNRPVFYAKNCSWRYCSGGLLSKGAICFTQNCLIEKTLSSDGCNYEVDSVGGTGTLPQSMEIDNVQSNCGVQAARNFPGTRNIQGSSAHRGYVCRINGVYQNNYGQNIADTNGDTAGEGTWMIGTICLNPYSEIGGGESLVGFNNLHVEGDTYLDRVLAGGRGSTNGLWVESGTCKTFDCSFSGTTAPAGANTGTLSTYDPYIGS